MPTAPTPARDAYQRFRPWRRSFEIGFWLVLTMFNGVANSITVLTDIQRLELDFEAWEPVVWEFSSGLTWLALALPIIWFTRRFPLHWDNWRSQLPWHLLASVVVSLLHVAGMVGLRILAYRVQGQEYDFGPWAVGLGYEYLKDVRTYVGIVVLLEFYRLLLRRMRGEARLLDAPDEGAPMEPLERPERFLVRKLGREFLIAASDIEWLQACGNYVNLRVRGHDYPLRSTIAGIESRLDPARFARVHRSYIVNLDLLQSIEQVDSGDARLYLKDGAVVPCSRRYREALRAHLGQGRPVSVP